MSYGAALVFDIESERALRALYQVTADAGISSFMLGLDYPPHMTLFMSETLDIPGLKAELSARLAGQPPTEVRFAALSTFLGGDNAVVYLNPVVSPGLLALHNLIWQSATAHVQGATPYYAPGVWVPHVTLAFNLQPGQVGTAVEVLRAAHPPSSAVVRGVMIGSYQLEGKSQVEEISFRAA